MGAYKQIIKFLPLTVALCGIVLTGCSPKTEGLLELKGKIVDKATKKEIPGRQVIIQGLVDNNDGMEPVEAGQFYSDGSGYFTYTLKKIKDARFYNFDIVGDSGYSYNRIRLGLYEIQMKARFLTLSTNKLEVLTIKIQKKSSPAVSDTLYLSVLTDGTDSNSLYPYEVENYGIADNSFVIIPGIGIKWTGLNIKSTVRAWVYADKYTKVNWEIIKDGKRKEYSDTLTCRRNVGHTIYFTF